jgi:hypothetical protein
MPGGHTQTASEKLYTMQNSRDQNVRNQAGQLQVSNNTLQPIQPIQPIQPVQAVQPVQPVQPVAPVQPIQPIQNQASAIPSLKRTTLSDLVQESGKIYNQLNQGGYKQQLQPTLDYIQSQIPEISKQFMQKSFKQNVTPETGLGGQIASKLLSDFQTNVLAPVLQQIGTQQAINAPKEQLALAQNMQSDEQTRIDKQVNDIKAGIDSGIFKPEQVQGLLAQAYGMPADIFERPDARKKVIDEYVQDTYFKQQRTPTLEEVNKGLGWLGMAPVSPDEWTSMFGQQSTQLKIEPTKISSLIAKLDAGQISEQTAADWGIPHSSSYDLMKGGSWNWTDTPQTRAKITELYTTNPDFRAWFDTNA